MFSRLLFIAAIFCTGTIGSAATSQTIGHAEAERRVTMAEREAEDLYGKAPRLREIDAVVRQDCAAKNQNKSADGSFCTCASAVTMSLWRSGADPKMVPRLQAFANDPNASAESFIAYEGPELYAPLCRLAER